MERIADLLLERVAPPGGSARPPLLFVHGMGGGSWYWANYLTACAEAGREAWALNLRGHHGSRPVPNLGLVSVLDYVQDVRDCLRVLGEVVLVGHSMGGLVAQKVAEAGGVRAAVLLTSAAPRGIVVLRWPVISRIFRYLGPVLFNRPLLPDRATADALIFNMLSPAQRQWAFDQLVPESGRATRELAFGLISVDPRRLTCPLLVVGTERDLITPPVVQRKIAARYRAEYLEMTG
ncbi:MAG: alpha/beta fold hydrolase, partial [candidate division NC10 bacterium]